MRDAMKQDEFANKQVKFDIYKYDLLEAVSVSLKHEFSLISNGWNIGVDLVKIFW